MAAPLLRANPRHIGDIGLAGGDSGAGGSAGVRGARGQPGAAGDSKVSPAHSRGATSVGGLSETSSFLDVVAAATGTRRVRTDVGPGKPGAGATGAPAAGMAGTSTRRTSSMGHTGARRLNPVVSTRDTDAVLTLVNDCITPLVPNVHVSGFKFSHTTTREELQRALEFAALLKINKQARFG